MNIPAIVEQTDRSPSQRVGYHKILRGIVAHITELTIRNKLLLHVTITVFVGFQVAGIVVNNDGTHIRGQSQCLNLVLLSKLATIGNDSQVSTLALQNGL